MPALDQQSIRTHESRLVVLNLVVLGGIATAHVLFAPVLGQPSRLFFVLLAARVSMQIGELTWLQTGAASCSSTVLLRYARSSIWLNLTFAFALSQSSGLEDSHYVVLMLIPVISAAYRYDVVGVVIVASSAAVMTFMEVYLFYAKRQVVQEMEYFEAANVVLIYAVVAFVVWILVRQFRDEHDTLARNIAELRATRDQLVREEKLAAIGRLASGVAHEIRNPVAMILSSVEMATQGRGDLPREELDAIVLEEARRLSRLTTDFLDYARHRAPERRTTETASIVSYVSDIARALASEKRVSLSTSCRENPLVVVDPSRIQQALVNLVMNAIDGAPLDGRVTIGANSSVPGVELWVENDGGPIPPDVADRLFEPFFTTKGSGTGLGLSIAKSIAEAHGGDVRLVKNEPGAIRFAIELPTSQPGSEEVCHAS